jgi:hypothetical protein
MTHVPLSVPRARPWKALAAFGFLIATTACVTVTGNRPVAGLITAPNRTADGAPSPESATVPVRLDNNRMFVELDFRRPDGSVRKSTAWVNTGGAALTLASPLRDELGRAAPVDFQIGGMPVHVDAKAVEAIGPASLAQAAGPIPVEAYLSAGVLKNFRVTLDYANRTLTLARPSDEPAPGVAVPIQVNPATGLVTVEAEIDGKTWPVVIDLGGGYTWLRGDVVRGWLASHPDWYRADGAVGQSNQAMVGFAFEQGGTAARVPLVRLGALEIHDVGVLGSSPAHASAMDRYLDGLFWRAWDGDARVRPLGWMPGNVLRNYRVTLDYKNHVSYWLKTSEPDPTDLNSVGISLVHTTKDYVVGGLVSVHGAVSVMGVAVGDRLTAVDGKDVTGATRGEVIAALHGAPGDHRRLTLERKGQTIQVDATVTQY